jgi:hypothetical protein
VLLRCSLCQGQSLEEALVSRGTLHLVLKLLATVHFPWSCQADSCTPAAFHTTSARFMICGLCLTACQFIIPGCLLISYWCDGLLGRKCLNARIDHQPRSKGMYKPPNAKVHRMVWNVRQMLWQLSYYTVFCDWCSLCSHDIMIW